MPLAISLILVSINSSKRLTDFASVLYSTRIFQKDGHRATEKGDELTPSHVCPKLQTGHRGYVAIRSTHCARQVLASKGSAKYCVSPSTLSPLNSMMLTV